MQLSSLIGLVALATSITAQQDTAPKPCAQQLGLYNGCVASHGGTGGCHAARLSREEKKECTKRCDDNAGYTLCTKEAACNTKHDTCVSQCNTHQDQCLVNVRAKFGPQETE